MALPHIKMHGEPQLFTKVRESSCKQRLLPFNKTVMKKRDKMEKACASVSTLLTFPLKRKSKSSSSVSPPFPPYYSIKKLDAFNYHSLMSTNESYGRWYSYFFPLQAFHQSVKGFPKFCSVFTTGVTEVASNIAHRSVHHDLSNSKIESFKDTEYSVLGKVHSSCSSPRKTSERSTINNEITWSLPLHNQHTSFLLRNLCFTPYAVSQEHITNYVFRMIQRIFWKVIQPSCWPSLFKILFLFHYKKDKCFYNLVQTVVFLRSKL